MIVPADVAVVAAVVLALFAFLAPQRSEASRARRATDRAQEIMGGRAEIAAMIAHEVRGPVSTVRGLAGTALSHYDRLDDDERRELLGLIEQESRRLLATVTQASTALKVDAATVTYDIRPQGLGATVREGIATADVGPAPARAGSGGRGGRARPEVDHRGRSPAGGQRGEVLAAGRPDPRERPGRGRRRDDRGDRRGTGHPRASTATTCSTSTRTGVPTGTNRRPDPAWGSSSSAASCSAIGERCTSSTLPVGVRCSASGSPWRASWTTDRAP